MRTDASRSFSRQLSPWPESRCLSTSRSHHGLAAGVPRHALLALPGPRWAAAPAFGVAGLGFGVDGPAGLQDCDIASLVPVARRGERDARVEVDGVVPADELIDPGLRLLDAGESPSGSWGSSSSSETAPLRRGCRCYWRAD